MNLTQANRATYRKFYQFGRVPPVLVTVGTATVDANRFQVHRDYYLIPVGEGDLGDPYAVGIYEDDFIWFNHESSKTVTFSQTFTEAPVVVVEVDATNPLGNIASFILKVTSATLQVGLSSEFSGSVRYRAIQASSYPARIYSGSVSFFGTATTVDVVASGVFSSSFAHMGGVPSSSFYSVYNYAGTGDMDVSFISSSTGSSTGAGDLSAPITNRVNFLGLSV